MKIQIAIITILLLFNSCGQKKELPGVFIRTKEWRGLEKIEGAEPMPKLVTDSITKLTTNYFEVELQSYHDGHYEGMKSLIEAQLDKEWNSKRFTMTDSIGNDLSFASSTDFLNFMSSRGYEVSNQTKLPDGFDYTFKRKMEN